MNPFGLRIAGLVYFMAILVFGLWNPRSAYILWMASLAAFLGLNWIIGLVHRAYCARFIRSKGGKLIQFGQPKGFITYGPSSYPWWVFYNDYDAVVSMNSREWRARIDVCGPVLALAAPSILCELEDNGTTVTLCSAD